MDNQPTVYGLGGLVPREQHEQVVPSGGSNKEELQELTVKIDYKCAELDLITQVSWFPRDRNMSADSLSHLWEDYHYDYTLPDVVMWWHTLRMFGDSTL